MSFETIDKTSGSADFTAACAWIDSQQAAMVESVIAWSKVNSGTANLDGISAMEQLVIAAAAPLDAEVGFVALGDGSKLLDDGRVAPLKNGRILTLTKRPQAARQILLTGHLDTVFDKGHPFQDVTWLDDNTLNGPGVADMKGGILVMLHGLMAFEKSAIASAVGWKIMLSPDEETGSMASGPILMEEAPKFTLGLTYEPALADGTLAGARKGSGNYSLMVKGVAAHAGRAFDDGRNAVVALSHIITEMAALTDMRAGFTVNPAVISGGVARNVVPDLAICRFNVRLNTAQDGLWFEDAMKDIIKPWQDKEGFDVLLHGGINRPPKHITPFNQALMDFIAHCGASLGLDVSYVATGGCCEGNNLAAAGLPNVDTLGVRGGMIHSEQEFLLVDSLSERAKLSALIIMAIAQGGFDDSIAAASQQ